MKGTLRAALIKLREEGPISPLYCICFNVTLLTGQSISYDNVIAVAAAWPKATDCLAYPIPNKSRELWVGDAGALRYELIDFMIKELSDDT